MLIDASHPEETRVVVVDGSRLEEFDVETSTKKQLKGNIYLAKVVRVEPSLQAAFVEYGGGRHGFLAFGEIHPDYYQIPVADRQRLIEAQAAEAREAEEEDDDEDETESAAPEAAAEPDPPVPVTEPPPPVTPEVPPIVPPPVPELPPLAPPPANPEVPLDAPPPGDPVAPPPGDPVAPPPGDPAAPSPAPRAQAMAIPVEIVHGPAPDAALPPAGDDAGPMGPTPDIVEVAAEPAPPPEHINAEAAGDQAEDDQPARRIPPKFLRNYKIQEVIKRRQILLVQVVKEERGNKGAALTTYLSLAGRYCVLMPNSPRGGGISRKITSAADRKRLREITSEMQMPDGMGLIVRTAGAQRPKAEIKRDCEYLLRLWDSIRETTLASSAPALIYEEASLIKRSIRDVYTRDVEEVVVEGEEAYRQAKDFMRMLMPSHARKVQPYRDTGMPLFVRERVEDKLDGMLSPTVQLKSGGYIVINQTEALVAIDVNSGRSTRERGIEETALRTNSEAADEVARQLRLRDLAGLIVVDFIDMESARHNASVERRLKDALKHDRARIQVGRISHFGLLEMSRQRLRPSLTEQAFVTCPHCSGTGLVRTTESAAMQVLRAIEEEAGKRRAAEIVVTCATPLALYLLNQKRERLAGIEAQAGLRVLFAADDSLNPPAHRIERTKAADPAALPPPPAPAPVEEADEPFEPEAPDEVLVEAEDALSDTAEDEPAAADGPPEAGEESDEETRRRRRRRRRRGRREDGSEGATPAAAPVPGLADQPAEDADADAVVADAPSASAAEGPDGGTPADAPPEGGDDEPRRRRRGRRGGRRRRAGEDAEAAEPADVAASADAPEALTPAAEAERPAATPRWSGPTPADPFATGDSYDVFAAMEAAEEAAAAAAAARTAAPPPEPAASVAEAAPPQATAAPDAPPADPPSAEAAPAAPAIQPILVDAPPADAPPRRGWWKR
jgi:ribonuclease E